MEMSTPAPQGVLPVRLAAVRLQPFAEHVTYTGQAVGYVEQDVVPRVMGTITWMPIYVGDKVKKGQLLAKLDTSQFEHQVHERTSELNAAQQGVSVSALEYQQALSAAVQAEAEASMAKGAAAEASSMLEAARQGRQSAAAQVQSAEADLQATKADLAAAQADRNFRQQDFQRMKALYDQGAISRSDWQRAEAESQKANAAVDRAQQSVFRSQAAIGAARSEQLKSNAEAIAAQRRVQQAESQVRAKQASAQTSKSAASAAKGRIGQTRAGAETATALLQQSLTERGYSELRAEVDGVIAARLVSPGVTVSAGQSILKVAQVAPIRLQANVPESDLGRIHPGARVRISQGDSQGEIIVRVTSVSPAVDPTSRTGIVEALYENKDSKLVPGQFISMDIEMGSGAEQLVVPTASIQTQEGASHVWVAKPLTGVEYVVARQPVEIAGVSGELAAVKSGLTAGQMVIESPPFGLMVDSRVVATSSPIVASQPTELTIQITESGYDPPSITLPAGKPAKVTFIRRDDKTCGTEVIFPDLGIKKALPLNQPVVVDIPAQAAGKALNFTCPMNMLKGKAVAR